MRMIQIILLAGVSAFTSSGCGQPARVDHRPPLNHYDTPHHHHGHEFYYYRPQETSANPARVARNT